MDAVLVSWVSFNLIYDPASKMTQPLQRVHRDLVAHAFYEPCSGYASEQCRHERISNGIAPHVLAVDRGCEPSLLDSPRPSSCAYDFVDQHSDSTVKLVSFTFCRYLKLQFSARAKQQHC